MTFIARWLSSLFLAFVLFPVLFVVWNGPDAEFGLIGGMMLMMFIQFFSPYHLWWMPLAFGTGAALALHVLAQRKAARPSG